MRKTSTILLIFAVMLLGSGIGAFAQTITISATIDRGVSLPSKATILKCPGTMTSQDNPWTFCDTTATSINFGKLSHTLTDPVTGAVTEAGCFYAPNFFIVYLFPSAFGGASYKIYQEFSWGSAMLEPGALVFTAVYSPKDKTSSDAPDQGPIPPGATLGNGGKSQAAVGGKKLVYDSGPAGLNRIMRAQYGLPPFPATGQLPPYDGWKPIPLNQLAGPYSGTLLISITE